MRAHTRIIPDTADCPILPSERAAIFRPEARSHPLNGKNRGDQKRSDQAIEHRARRSGERLTARVGVSTSVDGTLLCAPVAGPTAVAQYVPGFLALLRNSRTPGSPPL